MLKNSFLLLIMQTGFPDFPPGRFSENQIFSGNIFIFHSLE